jgi:zinc protease
MAAMTPTLVPDHELQMQLPLFSVHQEVLPSGLRLGVEEGETRGMVAVVTVVGTGSSADPPEREGLAHLVEHLVYHARNKGERPASARLARLGAHYNADTNLDTTRFFEVAPASSLTSMLDLAAERIVHPLAGVDEADFERERAIVENEINQRNETGVYGRVVAWMQTALFPPGHPYARPIGGSRASLRRLTLAEARNFAAEHYRPSNVALLVTGETAVTGVVTQVASRLPESITARTAMSAPPPAKIVQAAATTVDGGRATPPAGPQPRPDTLKAAVALPEIWLAYDLGGGGYESAVAKILAGPAAETAIRERLMPDPDVLAVDFHALELPGRTVLACQILVENDRRRLVIAQNAQNFIWGLWSDAPPPATVWQTWQQETVLDLRQAALADAIFDAEPFVGRALDRARAFHTTGAVEAYDRVLATIATVRPNDLSGRAYGLLAPARARTLFLEPVPEAERPAPGMVGVPSADNLPMAMVRLASDLGAPPRVSTPAGLRDAKVMMLLNGLTVVLVPRRQFPSVTALLGFYGGGAALPPGVLEVVRIAEKPLSQNRQPNKLEIGKVDGRGFTADFVRTDRRRLSNALYSLMDRLKIVAETDWSRLLARAQRNVSQSEPQPHEEPRILAIGQMQAALYGNHPYGRRIQLADLLALDPDLAPEWLPRLYNPRNGFLIIVGDFDVEVASWLVSGWFGSWQGRPDAGRLTAPPVPPPDSRPNRETVQITHRPVASQVEVAFSCRLAFPGTGRQRAAHRVLAGLLGGYLATQIREKAGAAYSIASGVASVPAGGAQLSVAMTVDTRRLRDALHVLHGELDALRTGRIDKGAVSQVRWALAGEDALDYQTGLKTAARIMQAFTLGLPMEALISDADEVGRVETEDLVKSFAPCLSSRVLSLIGDEATIRASM